MSIKTTYNFHNVLIPNAIIKIDRLWGSSKEGWTGYISVSTAELIPAVGVEGEDGYMPATPETTKLNKITEFNHSANFNPDERGYVSVYKSLQEKFGGEEV